jgi:hypothetical protein
MELHLGRHPIRTAVSRCPGQFVYHVSPLRQDEEFATGRFIPATSALHVGLALRGGVSLESYYSLALRPVSRMRARPRSGLAHVPIYPVRPRDPPTHEASAGWASVRRSFSEGGKRAPRSDGTKTLLCGPWIPLARE